MELLLLAEFVEMQVAFYLILLDRLTRDVWFHMIPSISIWSRVVGRLQIVRGVFQKLGVVPRGIWQSLLLRRESS